VQGGAAKRICRRIRFSRIPKANDERIHSEKDRGGALK
jgi:hypothetical protein